VRRRDFIAWVASAAAAASVAHAQQPKTPVIGFLRTTSPEDSAPLVAAFRRGLNETGYSEGQSVVIEYRWAEGHYDRLPALAAELVRREVTVLVAVGGDSAGLAAKAATRTIPIVFIAGNDPVGTGLVTSLNRPGGNATGIGVLTTSLDSKRLEAVRELVPTVGSVGILLHPAMTNLATHKEELRKAAHALGQQVEFVEVSSAQDLEKAFARFAEAHVGAVVAASSAYFLSQGERIIALAARHALPAIYEWREFVEAGGLMSYGTNLANAYRLAGVYAGRVLKGEKPADMPVQQSTGVELIINAKTAAALGLAIPPALLVRADEVIE
jgi:putative tryptophan/tyrosine transport system substrate-binding protein